MLMIRTFYRLANEVVCYVFYLIVVDQSKGFGGKYGVQSDRQDTVKIYAFTS